MHKNQHTTQFDLFKNGLLPTHDSTYQHMVKIALFNQDKLACDHEQFTMLQGKKEAKMTYAVKRNFSLNKKLDSSSF